MCVGVDVGGVAFIEVAQSLTGVRLTALAGFNLPEASGSKRQGSFLQ